MPPSSSVHVPVLAYEVMDWLQPRPGAVFVDGTLGGGGHTRLLADAVGTSGRVVALDRDPAALQRAERELAGLPVTVSQSDFSELPEVLAAAGIERVDGILLDLGLSSDQLADDVRGFAFETDGPLDLRFDPDRGEPAWRLLERLREEKLANLIYEYGEERYSRRIAREIVARRRSEPVRTARELADLVRRCVPKPKGHLRDRIHPATRTFQALRIAVNDELKSLEIALARLPDSLRPGGRLAVISFHSLEDRRVKEAFRDDERLDVLTRKPIRPTEAEVQANPRSRSAKLRVAERNVTGSHSLPSASRESGCGTGTVPAAIVSGGQTGADRGALDAAMSLGIPHGGWCPRGRRAEDGVIPKRYQLRETDSPQYHVRTEQNVIDSDGTLIVCRGAMEGGTLRTKQFAERHGKPLLVVDPFREYAAQQIRTWLEAHSIAVLNVAGHRESGSPGIEQQTFELVRAVFRSPRPPREGQDEGREPPYETLDIEC